MDQSARAPRVPSYRADAGEPDLSGVSMTGQIEMNPCFNGLVVEFRGVRQENSETVCGNGFECLCQIVTLVVERIINADQPKRRTGQGHRLVHQHTNTD